MSRADSFLLSALKSLPPKPDDSAPRPQKKRYSERMSAAIAAAFGEELRRRGLDGARPSGPGDVGKSGAERRMAGGIGAKKVDVTWSTEESGLLLAISVKSINFRDLQTSNFQKNLTNRRGDMLFESVTLHRRFPYAVLVGLFMIDKGADTDGSGLRKSTFENAHQSLRLFNGRPDPKGRDEQFEVLALGLVDANKFGPSIKLYIAGQPGRTVTASDLLTRAIEIIAERNPDFYEIRDGRLVPIGRRPSVGRGPGESELREPSALYDSTGIQPDSEDGDSE